ncbi:hypothetical protein B0T18DRAFT_404679 [Schizothecium vesticola]|uniref:Uncharacterized protein n=1 Tax=Schizothecium vesticola TaxID=314040 RepID=A0AA40KAX3_9PEZI|nr:hypothetical protein B0T18DRAFT_404679 [Schizothecium vesticola]
MTPLRSSLFAILAAVAIQATSPPSLDSFDHAALLARQAPGTPQFDCHSNCGNVIAGARVTGHCTNETWIASYDACIGCAQEFDIWKHYGNGVTAAAKPCNLAPTPSPSGGAAASTTLGSSSTAAPPSTTASPTRTEAASTPTGAGAATSLTVTAGAPASPVYGTPGGSLLGSLLAGVLGFAAAL